MDPVCGQCVYDLTRYRWLKHKYDVIEPAWRGYSGHHSTLPKKQPSGDDLPGAGLRQFPGLSWKLAVINAYLCLDASGQEKKPAWGRWPKELDYMLRQRGWTKGIEFVDGKKAETAPATLKPSDETPSILQTLNQFLSRLSRYWKIAITGHTGDTEDPEILALLVDWKPSQRALDNGLRLCDMDGMGPSTMTRTSSSKIRPRSGGPVASARLPRDCWGQAHVLGKVLEGHGLVIMQTDNFKLQLLREAQGGAHSELLRAIQFIPIYLRPLCDGIWFGLVLVFALIFLFS